MYRAVAVVCLRAGMCVPLDDDEVEQLRGLIGGLQLDVRLGADDVRMVVDDEDVTDLLRTPEVAMMASAVSEHSFVRRALVAQQRAIAERNGGVMEGRDIGTVVLPAASLKVYLTAAPEVRAERRWRELGERGLEVSLAQVQDEQDERDRRDSSRRDSPLTAAEDALVVDSSEMSCAEVVEMIASALQIEARKSRSDLD